MTSKTGSPVVPFEDIFEGDEDMTSTRVETPDSLKGERDFPIYPVKCPVTQKKPQIGELLQGPPRTPANSSSNTIDIVSSGEKDKTVDLTSTSSTIPDLEAVNPTSMPTSEPIKDKVQFRDSTGRIREVKRTPKKRIRSP